METLVEAADAQTWARTFDVAQAAISRGDGVYAFDPTSPEPKLELVMRFPQAITAAAAPQPRTVIRPRERRGTRRNGDTRAGPDEPRPRPGRRFEVDLLLGRSRPMNGHHEWPGSVVLVELILDEHRQLGLVRNAVARARIDRELDEQRKLEQDTCSRCGQIVDAENMTPGRAWCRPCETKRRKQAPSYRRAAA